MNVYAYFIDEYISKRRFAISLRESPPYRYGFISKLVRRRRSAACSYSYMQSSFVALWPDMLAAKKPILTAVAFPIYDVTLVNVQHRLRKSKAISMPG